MTFAITLIGGSWEFLAIIIVFGIGLIYGLYTKTGSGIAQRPYSNRWSDAPGANGASQISGKDGLAHLTSRGTR